MTFIADVQPTTGFLVPLVSAAIRALAVAGAAALALTAFRVKTISVRLFTWTAVLYAALAMPLLERLLPSLPVPAPAFVERETRQPETYAVQVFATTAGSADLTSTAASITPTAIAPRPHRGFEWSAIRWNLVAAGIYLALVFFLLARLFAGLTCTRRLRRSSQVIRDPRIADIFASHAQAEGLSFVPQAIESTLISVPVTTGVLRPVIFLPANWREWDDAKLDAVIAHEVSHVARRDNLTQRLSLLHCAIFWFSPLAWWLHRHLADLMEQASDEAALSGGVDRKVYARTLLGFFEALQAAPGRVWWQGVAMATAGRAERRAEERVEKILSWKGAVAMSLKKSIAVVVVAAAIPIVYVTASAHAAGRNLDSHTSGNVEVAQNYVAQNQAPPVAPQTAHSARASKKSSHHNFYSYGDDDNQSFVIVSRDNESVTMSGMQDDGLDALKKKIHGDFIWFRRDEKSYIIRDQSTIDRAKAFWAPQEQLGKKQEELGKQQEELGKQQEALSEKMEQVRVRVPDMTKELEKLQATLKKLNSDATMEEIGQVQSEIGELQSKIGDLQSHAGEQQGKLGDEMGALGEKQGKLGEQQGELGRQQGELAKQAEQQTKQLLDESITKGTAQVEP